MMKNPTKFIALLSGAALLASSSLFAGTATSVATAPVGYVTVDAKANADLKVGIPLLQPASFNGSVDSVTDGAVAVTGTVPDVTTIAHFLWVTSGPLVGKWYAVDSATASSVTVVEDLQTAGLVATNTFSVVPFWTLDTLLPDGGGVPASSDVFSPVAQVSLNDVTAVGVDFSPLASYLYHDGAQGPAGWYDVNDINGGLKGGEVVSPESYITIRNNTGSDAPIVITGTVPTVTIANNIVSRSAGSQDSQIANPFPASMTLANSELVTDGAMRASSDVFSPLDQLFVFATAPTGVDEAPIIAILYHDGAQGPAGWYDVNDINGGTIDDYEIPAGAALIIRRAAGADGLFTWVPSLPYSL